MSCQTASPKNEQSAPERLLQHACRLFVELGYQKTRTQDVCRAAGTNPAAVNYHFGGKAGLYKAVWDKALADAISASQAEALSSNADREWLYHYLRASMLALYGTGSGGDLQQLIQHEMDNPSPLNAEVLERHMTPRVQELERRLRRMLGPGTSDFQVACCIVAIHSQCTAVNLSRYMRELLFDSDAPTEEQVQGFAREICAFIMGGIRAMRAVPGQRKETPADKQTDSSKNSKQENK